MVANVDDVMRRLYFYGCETASYLRAWWSRLRQGNPLRSFARTPQVASSLGRRHSSGVSEIGLKVGAGNKQAHEVGADGAKQDRCGATQKEDFGDWKGKKSDG
jgi:hypothetical protein